MAGMTKNPTDVVEVDACGYGCRRKAMPEIVNAEFGHSCCLARSLPAVLYGGQVPLRIARIGEKENRILRPSQPGNDCQGRLG
jgi:hypothetical protein